MIHDLLPFKRSIQPTQVSLNPYNWWLKLKAFQVVDYPINISIRFRSGFFGISKLAQHGNRGNLSPGFFGYFLAPSLLAEFAADELQLSSNLAATCYSLMGTLLAAGCRWVLLHPGG